MMLKPDKDYLYLNEDSRASDDKGNQEIFPDVAAAVVFGLHEEDFFSKADVYTGIRTTESDLHVTALTSRALYAVYINTSSILLKVPQSQSNSRMMRAPANNSGVSNEKPNLYRYMPAVEHRCRAK